MLMGRRASSTQNLGRHKRCFAMLSWLPETDLEMNNTVLTWPVRLFAAFLALAYAWGGLSIQHYLPAGDDLYISLHVAFLLGAALVLFFAVRRPRVISFGALMWLALLLVLLLQPAFSPIVYQDALIFPVASVLLCALLAWALANLGEVEKEGLIRVLAWTLLVVGVLMVLSQWVQLLQWPPLLGVLVFYASGDRLVGNIAQVNQAVFVVTLGLAAAIYLFCERPGVVRHAVLVLLALFLGVGVGFSASRGGLLLAAAAILSGGVFYAAAWRVRVLRVLIFGLVVGLGYLAGTLMLEVKMADSTSALNRIMTENYVGRLYLLQQAWLAFEQNWLAGIGWGNFKHFGLQHAQQVEWFTVAHHAHNLLAQVAAELGVLGLVVVLGFAAVLIKNLRFSLPPHRAFAYAVLALLVMYSFSEFPLWYLRFLLLAPLFIGVIDASQWRLQLNLRSLALALALSLSLGSMYYWVQYQSYRDVAYLIQSERVPHEQQVAAFYTLPNVFGYSGYKELMLFMLYPVSEKRLDEQIALGHRVLSAYLSQFLMLKQANLLAVAQKSEQADEMYKAACVFNHGAECDKVIETLEGIAAERPDLYQGYLTRFRQWHKQHFAKTAPARH